MDLVIRPEDIVLLEKSSGSIQQADRLLKGRVQTCLFKGVHYEMLVETEGFAFMVHSTVACPVGADRVSRRGSRQYSYYEKERYRYGYRAGAYGEQDPTDPERGGRLMKSNKAFFLSVYFLASALYRRTAVYRHLFCIYQQHG